MEASKVVVDCSTSEVAEQPLTKEERAQVKADTKQAAEQQTAALRDERTARLAASDWTQLPDAGLDQAGIEAWRAYRQQLRDLPADTDPADPAWPDPPAAAPGKKTGRRTRRRQQRTQE